MAEILKGFLLAIINWIMVGWIWFELTELFEPETKPITKPENKPEPEYRSSAPAPKTDGKVDETRIEDLMRKPEKDAALSSTASPMDQDTGKSEVNRSPPTTIITEAYVQKLESDHQFYKQMIGQFQQKFQNLSGVVQGFEEVIEENQILKEKVKTLQKTVSEYKLLRLETTKTNLAKQEAIWRGKELQLSKDNGDLKKAIEQLQAENGRACEARDAAILSAEKSTKLTEEHVAVNGLLQENIVQLKAELSAFESKVVELKKEESVQREKLSTCFSTESQLLQEIANLKTVMRTENEILLSKMSELERIKDENQDKLAIIDQFIPQILELENEKSLLELKNADLKKDITDSHKRIEELQKQNQELLDTREAALLSAQKSEKLAEEQVTALSEALSALQEAVTHAKDAATAVNTGNDLGTAEATNTEEQYTDRNANGNRIGRWFNKHGIWYRNPRKETELTKLMESTGFLMVETAKNLQEQAENIKAKGKELIKKAKKLSRQ